MLLALLEREQFDPSEHPEPSRSFTQGWNARAQSLIRLLRVEAGLEELAWAPAWDRRPTLPGIAPGLDDEFDLTEVG